MQHYVVIIDWATEMDRDVQVLGVGHTIEEAKDIFNAHIEEERAIAEQNGYVVDDDNEVFFDAGIMGYWRDNHITLYIQGVM